MFTLRQLISFGQFIATKANIKQIISEKEVHDWGWENPGSMSQFESLHADGDKVLFCCAVDDKEEFPGIPAKINAVSFHRNGKVKYDITLLFADHETRIHSVDEILLVKRP